MNSVRCLFGMHDWLTVYEDGPRVVQRCARCGVERSTMYDMAYGGTYWVRGDQWSKNKEAADAER